MTIFWVHMVRDGVSNWAIFNYNLYETRPIIVEYVTYLAVAQLGSHPLRVPDWLL